ncbi:MAG: 2-C-methyl-D-erythritol 4-phosphate cytidylyltransferase [Ruminococcus sp.]|nr:2-C-methyl-D-erythritol 4-phosphate cytidylyltransferase [Ruminococcus sp.]
MQTQQDTSAILVCAGSASRMQGQNKILLPLGKTNVAGTAMLALEQCSRIAEIIIVARPCDHEALRETAAQCGITKLKTIVEGGSTRQASVMQGLRQVSAEAQMIAIHDGARPLVRPEHIDQVIRDASVFGGATLGVPVKDTIKIVNDGLITDTPYRPSLYITQTPQVFRKSIYLKAVQFAVDHELDFTDDCQLAEAIGCKVYMTTGDYTNIKITTPEDIEIAQLLLRRCAAKEDAK